MTNTSPDLSAASRGDLRARVVATAPRVSCTFAICSFLVAAILIVGPLSARAVDTPALRRRLEAQERARDMARRLVSGILDVQLKQLEENGLTELPLYREIAGMKKNIGAIVDKEMERAVELLVEAQQGDEAHREQAFKRARQTIREIVMRLSAERQNLLRRLKSAELAAQVNRLIDFQGKVWNATKTLPDQPSAKQEQTALASIEDQGDVKQLFLQLIEALSDVSHWDGPLGSGAADALRILEAADVGSDLDRAGAALRALQYLEAAQSQQQVLKGLRLLKEKLEDTQGLLGADRQGALALARELLERQEKLREKTKDADLSRDDAERLVEEQAALRKDLNKLAQGTASVPAAEPLLEQAKAGGYEATGRLFDTRKEDALGEQGKVVANLAEIAEKLASAADADLPDKSAAEYKRLVADLEKAAADMKQIRQQQTAVDRAAPQDSARGARDEKQVAEALARVADGRQLPRSVGSRLGSAQQAAAAAAQALGNIQGNATGEKELGALEGADRAVERAASEIATTLNDARRKAVGVQIGELARAAETLERAAAAERDFARTASAAASNEGLAANEAKQMSERQAQIAQIARKTAEGVAEAAADAADSARAAADEAAAARTALEQAGKDGAGKAGTEKSARAAASAAAKLSEAASRLRKEIESAAEKLTGESDRQLAGVSPLRESADAALAQSDAGSTETASKLAKADRQVRQAMAAQQRAAGRTAAADALQLADALGDALDQQTAADRAAEQFAGGKSPSPLEMITGQQRVAEQAAQLADIAGKRPQAQKFRAAGDLDPITEKLHEAHRAASRAAKAALNGNTSTADAARGEARRALSEAAARAAGESDEAARGPAGNPDPAAQKLVTEGAASAAKLVAGTVPAAAQSLEEAEQASTEAQQKSQSGFTEQAAAAQATADLSLRDASAQIRAAQKQLARKQKKQLVEESHTAGDLAERSVAVDAAALGALRDAQTKASQGSDEPADDSDRAQNAQTQARRDMERAAANLNAREQRLLRDKAIAEALRQTARDQDQAAEQIARQSDELATLPNDNEDDEAPAGTKADQGPREDVLPEGTPTAKEKNYLKARTAAEHLAQAQRDFAQAQRATGEGAAEISEQSQIANKPLREAMQLATNLPAQNVGRPTGAFGRGSEKLNPSAEGSEEGPGAGKGESAASKPSASQQKPSGNSRPGSGSQEMKSPAGRQRGGSEGNELGTGFVPNSPEATAQMMAGAEANERAGELLPAGTPSDAAHQDAAAPAGEFPNPDAGEAGENSGSQSDSAGKRPPPSSGSKSKGGGQSNDGQQGDNNLRQGPPKAGESSRRKGNGGAAPGHDADVAARRMGQEAWFAKLPADLRNAIRAKAQRPPPRSYEEKLQKYFESID